MHQMVSIYYFFWVRYHPSKVYFQKKSWQETKYRPPFPPTTKPRPLNPFDRGPTSLVLAGYRLVVLRPFCFCLLSFPHHFCCSRLVLFRPTVYLLSYFFTHFLRCLSFPLVWLFFSSCNSCYWHFLLLLVSFLSCFYISVFTPIFFYTKRFKPLWAK